MKRAEKSRFVICKHLPILNKDYFFLSINYSNHNKNDSLEWEERGGNWERGRALVWLHQIMCLFIVYMNGIVFSSFAYSNLFPRIAYNFLCAEPASLGPGENPTSCFHPQMLLVGMRCAVCHAENPAILICGRDSHCPSPLGHSLSHSLPQATPWGFFHVE